MDHDGILKSFQNAWPLAKETWASYIMLSEPLLMASTISAAKEGLKGSFAMIRLNDKKIVIDLEQVACYDLHDLSHEILAHEVGHHVYCPGDLTTAAQLIRVTCDHLSSDMFSMAPLLTNLYADLLINDRLKRWFNLRMTELYLAIASKSTGPSGDIWKIYLRTYELLWSLPKNTYISELSDDQQGAAMMLSRIVRVYERDWLMGMARFTQVLLPYLYNNSAREDLRKDSQTLADSDDLCQGESGLPSGLVASRHRAIGSPYDDTNLNPQASETAGDADDKPDEVKILGIDDYVKLAHVLNAAVGLNEIVIQYYRERAQPYILIYPETEVSTKTEPVFSGHDLWQMGDDLGDLDILHSLTRQPHLIPDLTTEKIRYDLIPGSEKNPSVADIYIGIDCSGSMTNPQVALSYPALAGVVVALNALRAGARVMVCLSGETVGCHESHNFAATDGFTNNESQILATLTSYIGTGSYFGINRLAQHLLVHPPSTPYHVLLITDGDMSQAMNEKFEHCDAHAILTDVLGAASTCHVVMNQQWGAEVVQAVCRRLSEISWHAYSVSSDSQLAAFAQDFSDNLYGKRMHHG